MKHHIIVKFNEGTDVDGLLEPVEEILHIKLFHIMILILLKIILNG